MKLFKHRLFYTNNKIFISIVDFSAAALGAII
jgi:hypothetical protein